MTLLHGTDSRCQEAFVVVNNTAPKIFYFVTLKYSVLRLTGTRKLHARFVGAHRLAHYSINLPPRGVVALLLLFLLVVVAAAAAAAALVGAAAAAAAGAGAGAGAGGV